MSYEILPRAHTPPNDRLQLFWYNSLMQIRQIVRISDQGVSRPYQCYDEEGTLRWCKGNHTGIRSLLSEWICARVAQRLGLPVPACDILRLDPVRFQDWARCRGELVPQLVTDANPYVFASANVADSKDVIDIEEDLRCDDPVLLARILLFDELVHNTDRTDDNTNLLANAGVHVIDHNNAFDPAFEREVFLREHVLRRFAAAGGGALAAEFAAEVREVVTERFLDEVWAEMPVAWTEAGCEMLTLEIVKSVLLREDF